ncbi:uncharacterized protein OCT59_011501 [Rhizophagus irregularis]|uniref:uncharacterized protein n=1 Tax=Rhizophagus irregularis TaxID=588596 RepID=UPI00331D7834|nr:hypothetical protein OCT59_011501 [Rhizophagus irregularis]
MNGNDPNIKFHVTSSTNKNFFESFDHLRQNSNTTHNTDSQTYVNKIYEDILQSINRTIKSPIIKNNSHQYEYSHNIRVIQNDIYYILKLIKLSKLYFSINNNTKHLPLLNFWNGPKKLNRLNRISNEPKIKPILTQDDQEFIWPNNLTYRNFIHTITTLQSIHEILKTSYEEEISIFNKKKIEKYINQRDNNIIINQKRMLNSLLDQKPNIIKIDRLIYDDKNGIKSFTTDPQQIESLAITHYTNISKIESTSRSYDPDVILRQPWKDIYQPFTHIPSSAYNKLIDPITLDELITNIKDLPNNKATGPNNISNEIIKKLPSQMLEVILSLFNYSLEKGIIPSQFDLAYLYPIPKPQWWNYDINLTRPIILLDCIRKLMVKIINSRLNHYLSTNQILQHNNQAGIQGASCNEIILQIQAIIDHQYDTKNPFYLALQDLILNSSQYTNDNGIIQEEVISPLLWVIYYDPMFAAINKSSFPGYNLYAAIPKNIFRRDDLHEISINIKLLGYLDDTTWFAQNFDDLQNNLAIADDFYAL